MPFISLDHPRFIALDAKKAELYKKKKALTTALTRDAGFARPITVREKHQLEIVLNNFEKAVFSAFQPVPLEAAVEDAFSEAKYQEALRKIEQAKQAVYNEIVRIYAAHGIDTFAHNGERQAPVFSLTDQHAGPHLEALLAAGNASLIEQFKLMGQKLEAAEALDYEPQALFNDLKKPGSKFVLLARIEGKPLPAMQHDADSVAQLRKNLKQFYKFFEKNGFNLPGDWYHRKAELEALYQEVRRKVDQLRALTPATIPPGKVFVVEAVNQAKQLESLLTKLCNEQKELGRYAALRLRGDENVETLNEILSGYMLASQDEVLTKVQETVAQKIPNGDAGLAELEKVDLATLDKQFLSYQAAARRLYELFYKKFERNLPIAVLTVVEQMNLKKKIRKVFSENFGTMGMPAVLGTNYKDVFNFVAGVEAQKKLFSVGGLKGIPAVAVLEGQLETKLNGFNEAIIAIVESDLKPKLFASWSGTDATKAARLNALLLGNTQLGKATYNLRAQAKALYQCQLAFLRKAEQDADHVAQHGAAVPLHLEAGAGVGAMVGAGAGQGQGHGAGAAVREDFDSANFRALTDASLQAVGIGAAALRQVFTNGQVPPDYDFTTVDELFGSDAAGHPVALLRNPPPIAAPAYAPAAPVVAAKNSLADLDTGNPNFKENFEKSLKLLERFLDLPDCTHFKANALKQINILRKEVNQLTSNEVFLERFNEKLNQYLTNPACPYKSKEELLGDPVVVRALMQTTAHDIDQDIQGRYEAAFAGLVNFFRAERAYAFNHIVAADRSRVELLLGKMLPDFNPDNLTTEGILPTILREVKRQATPLITAQRNYAAAAHAYANYTSALLDKQALAAPGFYRLFANMSSAPAHCALPSGTQVNFPGHFRGIDYQPNLQPTAAFAVPATAYAPADPTVARLNEARANLVACRVKVANYFLATSLNLDSRGVENSINELINKLDYLRQHQERLSLAPAELLQQLEAKYTAVKNQIQAEFAKQMKLLVKVTANGQPELDAHGRYKPTNDLKSFFNDRAPRGLVGDAKKAWVNDRVADCVTMMAGYQAEQRQLLNTFYKEQKQYVQGPVGATAAQRLARQTLIQRHIRDQQQVFSPLREIAQAAPGAGQPAATRYTQLANNALLCGDDVAASTAAMTAAAATNVPVVAAGNELAVLDARFTAFEEINDLLTRMLVGNDVLSTLRQSPAVTGSLNDLINRLNAIASPDARAQRMQAAVAAIAPPPVIATDAQRLQAGQNVLAAAQGELAQINHAWAALLHAVEAIRAANLNGPTVGKPLREKVKADLHAKGLPESEANITAHVGLLLGVKQLTDNSLAPGAAVAVRATGVLPTVLREMRRCFIAARDAQDCLAHNQNANALALPAANSAAELLRDALPSFERLVRALPGAVGNQLNDPGHRPLAALPAMINIGDALPAGGVATAADVLAAADTSQVDLMTRLDAFFTELQLPGSPAAVGVHPGNALQWNVFQASCARIAETTNVILTAAKRQVATLAIDDLVAEVTQAHADAQALLAAEIAEQAKVFDSPNKEALLAFFATQAPQGATPGERAAFAQARLADSKEALKAYQAQQKLIITRRCDQQYLYLRGAIPPAAAVPARVTAACIELCTQQPLLGDLIAAASLPVPAGAGAVANYPAVTAQQLYATDGNAAVVFAMANASPDVAGDRLATIEARYKNFQAALNLLDHTLNANPALQTVRGLVVTEITNLKTKLAVLTSQEARTALIKAKLDALPPGTVITEAVLETATQAVLGDLQARIAHIDIQFRQLTKKLEAIRVSSLAHAPVSAVRQAIIDARTINGVAPTASDVDVHLQMMLGDAVLTPAAGAAHDAEVGTAAKGALPQVLRELSSRFRAVTQAQNAFQADQNAAAAAAAQGVVVSNAIAVLTADYRANGPGFARLARFVPGFINPNQAAVNPFPLNPVDINGRGPLYELAAVAGGQPLGVLRACVDEQQQFGGNYAAFVAQLNAAVNPLVLSVFNPTIESIFNELKVVWPAARSLSVTELEQEIQQKYNALLPTLLAKFAQQLNYLTGSNETRLLNYFKTQAPAGSTPAQQKAFAEARLADCKGTIQAYQNQARLLIDRMRQQQLAYLGCAYTNEAGQAQVANPARQAAAQKELRDANALFHELATAAHPTVAGVVYEDVAQQVVAVDVRLAVPVLCDAAPQVAPLLNAGGAFANVREHAAIPGGNTLAVVMQRYDNFKAAQQRLQALFDSNPAFKVLGEHLTRNPGGELTAFVNALNQVGSTKQLVERLRAQLGAANTADERLLLQGQLDAAIQQLCVDVEAATAAIDQSFQALISACEQVRQNVNNLAAADPIQKIRRELKDQLRGLGQSGSDDNVSAHLNLLFGDEAFRVQATAADEIRGEATGPLATMLRVLRTEFVLFKNAQRALAQAVPAPGNALNAAPVVAEIRDCYQRNAAGFIRLVGAMGSQPVTLARHQAGVPGVVINPAQPPVAGAVEYRVRLDDSAPLANLDSMPQHVEPIPNLPAGGGAGAGVGAGVAVGQAQAQAAADPSLDLRFLDARPQSVSQELQHNFKERITRFFARVVAPIPQAVGQPPAYPYPAIAAMQNAVNAYKAAFDAQCKELDVIRSNAAREDCSLDVDQLIEELKEKYGALQAKLANQFRMQQRQLIMDNAPALLAYFKARAEAAAIPLAEQDAWARARVADLRSTLCAFHEEQKLILQRIKEEQLMYLQGDINPQPDNAVAQDVQEGRAERKQKVRKHLRKQSKLFKDIQTALAQVDGYELPLEVLFAERGPNRLPINPVEAPAQELLEHQDHNVTLDLLDRQFNEQYSKAEALWKAFFETPELQAMANDPTFQKLNKELLAAINQLANAQLRLKQLRDSPSVAMSDPESVTRAIEEQLREVASASQQMQEISDDVNNLVSACLLDLAGQPRADALAALAASDRVPASFDELVIRDAIIADLNGGQAPASPVELARANAKLEELGVVVTSVGTEFFAAAELMDQSREAFSNSALQQLTHRKAVWRGALATVKKNLIAATPNLDEVVAEQQAKTIVATMTEDDWVQQVRTSKAPRPLSHADEARVRRNYKDYIAHSGFFNVLELEHYTQNPGPYRFAAHFSVVNVNLPVPPGGVVPASNWVGEQRDLVQAAVDVAAQAVANGGLPLDPRVYVIPQDRVGSGYIATWLPVVTHPVLGKAIALAPEVGEIKPRPDAADQADVFSKIPAAAQANQFDSVATAFERLDAIYQQLLRSRAKTLRFLYSIGITPPQTDSFTQHFERIIGQINLLLDEKAREKAGLSIEVLDRKLAEALQKLGGNATKVGSLKYLQAEQLAVLNSNSNNAAIRSVLAKVAPAQGTNNPATGQGWTQQEINDWYEDRQADCKAIMHDFFAEQSALVTAAVDEQRLFLGTYPGFDYSTNQVIPPAPAGAQPPAYQVAMDRDNASKQRKLFAQAQLATVSPWFNATCEKLREPFAGELKEVVPPAGAGGVAAERNYSSVRDDRQWLGLKKDADALMADRPAERAQIHDPKNIKLEDLEKVASDLARANELFRRCFARIGVASFTNTAEILLKAFYEASDRIATAKTRVKNLVDSAQSGIADQRAVERQIQIELQEISDAVAGANQARDNFFGFLSLIRDQFDVVPAAMPTIYQKLYTEIIEKFKLDFPGDAGAEAKAKARFQMLFGAKGSDISAAYANVPLGLLPTLVREAAARVTPLENLQKRYAQANTQPLMQFTSAEKQAYINFRKALLFHEQHGAGTPYHFATRSEAVAQAENELSEFVLTELDFVYAQLKAFESKNPRPISGSIRADFQTWCVKRRAIVQRAKLRYQDVILTPVQRAHFPVNDPAAGTVQQRIKEDYLRVRQQMLASFSDQKDTVQRVFKGGAKLAKNEWQTGRVDVRVYHQVAVAAYVAYGQSREDAKASVKRDLSLEIRPSNAQRLLASVYIEAPGFDHLVDTTASVAAVAGFGEQAHLLDRNENGQPASYVGIGLGAGPVAGAGINWHEKRWGLVERDKEGKPVPNPANQLVPNDKYHSRERNGEVTGTLLDLRPDVVKAVAHLKQDVAVCEQATADDLKDNPYLYLNTFSTEYDSLLERQGLFLKAMGLSQSDIDAVLQPLKNFYKQHLDVVISEASREKCSQQDFATFQRAANAKLKPAAIQVAFNQAIAAQMAAFQRLNIKGLKSAWNKSHFPLYQAKLPLPLEDIQATLSAHQQELKVLVFGDTKAAAVNGVGAVLEDTPGIINAQQWFVNGDRPGVAANAQAQLQEAQRNHNALIEDYNPALLDNVADLAQMPGAGGYKDLEALREDLRQKPSKAGKKLADADAKKFSRIEFSVAAESYVKAAQRFDKLLSQLQAQRNNPNALAYLAEVKARVTEQQLPTSPWEYREKGYEAYIDECQDYLETLRSAEQYMLSLLQDLQQYFKTTNRIPNSQMVVLCQKAVRDLIDSTRTIAEQLQHAQAANVNPVDLIGKSAAVIEIDVEPEVDQKNEVAVQRSQRSRFALKMRAGRRNQDFFASRARRKSADDLLNRILENGSAAAAAAAA
jgi:hypothetical protein